MTTLGESLRRSLRARIALALSLTAIVILLLCGWLFFVYARNVLVARTSETLAGVASIVASGLPTDELETYLATAATGNPDLTAEGLLLAQLQDVADRASVSDLYLVDGENHVLLDARRRLPFAEEDYGLSLVDEAVERAWNERATVATPLFERPEGGHRLAALAPVLSRDGRPLALVGAERALPSLAVTDSLRDAFLWILAAGILLSLLTAGVVSSTILRPVQRLVSGMRAADASGYPPPVAQVGADEIGFLTASFNRLIADLRSKDAELRALYGREKARADLVLAGIPTAVVGVDPDGVVRLWNPAAAAVLGVHAERALNAAARDLTLPEAVQRGLERARGGETLPAARVRWHARDGQRVLEVSAVPYHDGQGRLLGAVALVADVTERVRLEEELRTRERLAALGEMSAGIAHEVRNPLGVMEGFAGLLARRLEDARALELVAGIRREIETLNEIVATFTRFARTPILARRNTDLGVLLEELLPYFRRDDVEVKLELDGVPPLHVDPEEMRTALANLIRNAIEAQPQGGTVVVRAVFDAARGVHVIRVEDRGPGVRPEVVERIFDPFFSTKSEGTGMGLALVHRIVTAHGGTVRLAAADAGATFEIELPAGDG